MIESDQRFEEFLRGALAPVKRPEDLAFVARVQAVARLEDRWAAERLATWWRFALNLSAVAALAGGVAAITAAPSFADAVIANRPFALAALLVGFGAWVSLLARPESRSLKGAGLAGLRASGT